MKYLMTGVWVGYAFFAALFQTIAMGIGILLPFLVVLAAIKVAVKIIA